MGKKSQPYGLSRLALFTLFYLTITLLLIALYVTAMKILVATLHNAINPIPGRPNDAQGLPKDSVDVSTFAPQTAQAGASFFVQMLFSPTIELDDLFAFAKGLDPETVEQTVPVFAHPLSLAVGDEVKVTISKDRLRCREPNVTFVWHGNFRPLQFEFAIPGNAVEYRIYSPVLTVYVNDKVVGHQHLRVNCTSDRNEPLAVLPVPTPMSPQPSMWVSMQPGQADQVAPFVFYDYKEDGVDLIWSNAAPEMKMRTVSQKAAIDRAEAFMAVTSLQYPLDVDDVDQEFTHFAEAKNFDPMDQSIQSRFYIGQIGASPPLIPRKLMKYRPIFLHLPSNDN